MKLPVLAAVVALAGTAGVATATASDHSALAHASACIPKISTAKGHTSVTSCGPAVATVKIGSRTYAFKDGTCQKDSAAHLVLTIDLGTLVVGATGNDGQTYFSLQLITAGSFKIDTVSVYYGGKQLLSADPISVQGSNPSAGAFTSTKSLLGGSVHFTGTWNCHGAVTAVP
jgi:hypothetical protein